MKKLSVSITSQLEKCEFHSGIHIPCLPLSMVMISSNLWIKYSQSQFWWGSFNKFSNLACIFQFVHEICKISLDAQASRYLIHIPKCNVYPFSNNSIFSSCIYCSVSFNLIIVSQFNTYWSITLILCVCVCAKSLHSCLTLCDPMHHSPPNSSVHGILQARILEWVALPSSRGSSQPRDRTHVSYISCVGRRVLYH